MKVKSMTIEVAWRCPWNSPSHFNDDYYCTHQDGPTNCLRKKFPATCPLRTHNYLIKRTAPTGEREG